MIQDQQNSLFSVSYVIVVIGVMAVVFSISIVFMMAYDYHIYLAGNRRRKFSFADFIKREQYYLYILVFFLLIIIGEPTLKSKACLKCLYFTIIIFDLCRYLEYFSYLYTINQTE